MTDADDPELTPEDKRTLKRLATHVREEWPNRRQILGGTAMALGGAAAGSLATGSAAAQPTGDEGAVGTQANPVEAWISEMDATEVTTDSGTITSSDKDIPGIPSSSSDATPGFGSWTQASADRPAEVLIEATAETDGTTSGRVVVDVDESGGTTADYTRTVSEVPAGLGSGQNMGDSVSLPLPAGAQYQIRNDTDPNNDNAIDDVREMVK